MPNEIRIKKIVVISNLSIMYVLFWFIKRNQYFYCQVINKQELVYMSLKLHQRSNIPFD